MSNSANLFASESDDLFFASRDQHHIKQNFVDVEKNLVVAKLRDTK